VPKIAILRQRPQASGYTKALASLRNVGNRSTYHRTVTPMAVGDVLFCEASLKTADAAITKASNATIAAKSIDLRSLQRLSKLLSMERAPVTDASSNVRLQFGSNHTRLTLRSGRQAVGSSRRVQETWNSSSSASLRTRLRIFADIASEVRSEALISRLPSIFVRYSGTAIRK
jgi:hypothetical protein